MEFPLADNSECRSHSQRGILKTWSLIRYTIGPVDKVGAALYCAMIDESRATLAILVV